MKTNLFSEKQMFAPKFALKTQYQKHLKSLLTAFLLLFSVFGWGQATDLFISEYVEGSSSNKYIEIYNGTGASVDLSGYRLRLYANGALTPTNDVLLSGMLANGSVIVYQNSAATLYAGINNTALTFNGDDAVALFKISTSANVDIFGVIGNDPGTAWTATGYSTLDKTLRRKSTVCGGVTVSPTGTGAGAFTTLSTEWDIFNVDTVTGLGSHTASCISGPALTISDPSTTLSLGTTICQGSRGTGTYTVSGSNLTADIELAPTDTDIEISTSSTFATVFNSTSNPKLTLAQSSGVVASTTIHVRSVTSLGAGAFTSSIAHTSTGATTATKNVSGTVIAPQTPTVSIARTSGATSPMCGSQSITFTATTANLGSGTASLQWKVNGTNVGTAATYTLVAPANNDVITCEITNVTGGCVTATTANSNTITLTVNALPNAPATPTSDNAACGNVTLTRGTPPANETWYWQGTDANGISETNSSNTYIASSSATYYIRSKNTTTGCWSSSTGITVTVNSAAAISTQPANQSISVGNQATFTVAATGTGLSYQWQVDKGSGFANVTVSDGTGGTTASFVTVATTAAMTGYKYRVIITGTCGNITSDGNATLTVVAISYAQGNFLSITGTGNYEDNTSWSRCNQIGGCTGTTIGSGGWGAIGISKPVAASSVFIQGTITLNNALGVENSTILSGGNLIVNSQHAVSGSMLIKSGGKVTNKDRLNFGSEVPFNIEDGGSLVLDSYQDNPNTSLWNGSENFAANSTVTINYADRGNPLFSGASIISTNPSTNALFGNLIIQPTTFNDPGHWTGIFPNGNYTLTKNDLTINNNSNRNFTLNGGEITVGRNMFVNNTTSTDVVMRSTSGTIFTVLGNLTTTGTSTGVFRLNGIGNFTLNIKGNLLINSGIFRLTGFLPSTISNVSLEGDLFVGSSAILQGNASNLANNRFFFAGTGLISETTQDINVTNASTASDIAFNVNPGAYAKLASNFKLGAASTFTVKGTSVTVKGVFDADDKTLSGTSTNAVTVNDFGLFKTANALGFSGGTTTSLGSNIAAINLDAGSTVDYYSAADQIVTNGAITSPTGINYQNLEISGTGLKTGATVATGAATGNIIVNQITKINDGAKLHIAETADNVAPNVLRAKGGINVSTATGTELIFKNNANLIQDADAVNSGSVQAERKTSMKKMDYTYWSAPVTGQILKNTGATANTENSTGGFSPGTPNSRIFRYNEPNDYFVATTDNDFIPGKGYAIRGKNGYGTTKTPDTFSFTGTPNNGDAITVTVQRSPDTTSGANTYQHGYNLIGNPYPSGLNFYNFFDQNQTKITGKAWFWSNAYDTLYQTGSVNYLVNNYAVLTLLGGSPPTYGDVEGPTGYTPTENIKLGQGFIIQVRPELTSTQPVLTFANTMRTTGAGAFFNNFKNQPESKNRYWVKFVSPDNVVNTILLGYVAQATNDYDMDYDAELFTVGDDSFYSLLGTRKMQIQAKGEFVQDSKIDIGTKQNKDGNYTIKIEQPEGVFANGQAIYLHDKLNGTYTNLLEQNYTFSAIKGATENRFEIVYKSGAVLATGGNTKESLQVYRNGENFIVKSANKKIDEVEVYDASGRLFQKLKGNTTEFVINATTLSSGMYILKIKRNNETISKKIMK